MNTQTIADEVRVGPARVPATVVRYESLSPKVRPIRVEAALATLQPDQCSLCHCRRAPGVLLNRRSDCLAVPFFAMLDVEHGVQCEVSRLPGA